MHSQPQFPSQVPMHPGGFPNGQAAAFGNGNGAFPNQAPNTGGHPANFCASSSLGDVSLNPSWDGSVNSRHNPVAGSQAAQAVAGMGPGMGPIKLQTPEALALQAKKQKAAMRKAKYQPYAQKRQDTLYYIEDEMLAQMSASNSQKVRQMLPRDSDWNYWNRVWACMQHIEQCQAISPKMCASFKEWLASEEADEASTRKERFSKFKQGYKALGYKYCKKAAEDLLFTDVDIQLMMHNSRDDGNGIDFPGSFEQKLSLALNYLKTTNCKVKSDEESIVMIQEILTMLEDKATGSCRC